MGMAVDFIMNSKLEEITKGSKDKATERKKDK